MSCSFCHIWNLCSRGRWRWITCCCLIPVFAVTDIMEPEGEVLNPSPFPRQVQFACGKLVVAGQWHHLAVTVAKEGKKNCIVSAYVNGQMLGSAKVKALCTDLVPDFCLALLFIFTSQCTYHHFSVLIWETPSMVINTCNTCHSAGCEWSETSRKQGVLVLLFRSMFLAYTDALN